LYLSEILLCFKNTLIFSFFRSFYSFPHLSDLSTSILFVTFNRKLKNRVAAQTARDRKKAKMSDLEEALALIAAEKRELLAENTTLKQCINTLSREKCELKARLVSSAGNPSPPIGNPARRIATVKSQVCSVSSITPVPCTPVVVNLSSPLPSRVDVEDTGRLSEPLPEFAVLSSPQPKEEARTVVLLAYIHILLALFLTMWYVLFVYIGKISQNKSLVL